MPGSKRHVRVYGGVEVTMTVTTGDVARMPPVRVFAVALVLVLVSIEGDRRNKGDDRLTPSLINSSTRVFPIGSRATLVNSLTRWVDDNACGVELEGRDRDDGLNKRPMAEAVLAAFPPPPSCVVHADLESTSGYF